MDPATFGETIADVYDELFAEVPAAAIETLTELAGADGRVLELGIGTGRLALPLATRGLEVHGIDASPRMVEKLRAKPGGELIAVTVGDFADPTGVDGAPFDLVFCAFNTLFALLTQEEQVRCFQGVASLLGPGGAFLIEAFVPDLERFDNPQPATVASLDEHGLLLEGSCHVAVDQRVSSRLLRIRDGQLRVYPIEIRYAWPSELDLMARLAGLRLDSRWSGWDREPFGSGSTGHVSVYRRGE